MGFVYRLLRSQLFTTLPEATSSFKGQTVIVTGANTGVGLETSRYIASHGAARVILACRNLHKARAAADDILATTSRSKETIDIWQLDMCSYASVLAFADKVRAELTRLDTVVINAGVNNLKFRMAELDEETITINVVGAYLLAFLLHPKLRETARALGTPTHCSIVGSDTYEVGQLSERKVAPEGKLFQTLSDEKTAKMGDRYPNSKLMVLLVSREMASIAPMPSSGVIINVSNPGLTQSNLGAEDIGRGLLVRAFLAVLARATEVGARNLIAAASAGPESHGKFVSDCLIQEADRALAKGEEGLKLQKLIWAELREKLEAIRPGVTWIA